MSLCNKSQFASLSALAFGTQCLTNSCEVMVSIDRKEKIMENYHRICDHNSLMERCPKLVTYRLFQIVIVTGRRERNVKWHPLSDDRKHIWQQCDHCARHFLQEPACLFVSPKTHPPGALSNGPGGGVVYKNCICSTSFSSNICLRCLWRSYWRIGDLPQGPQRDTNNWRETRQRWRLSTGEV